MTDILSLSHFIGGTGLFKLDFPYCNLYTKLEFQNLFGSIKDRPAFYIMQRAIADRIVDMDTTIIESTSGNFGIALAFICKAMGMKFIAVVDPNISRQKEEQLNLIAHSVIKVREPDHTGGYLLNRIATVERFLKDHPNSFNPNQYENENNYLSYYHTLGEEICRSFSKLDLVFISVSSGGTITGLSIRLKERFPSVKIIAVDIEGSLIFSDTPQKRCISGIGASLRSPLLDRARIDTVITLSQQQIVQGCNELLKMHALFVGPSSGAAYMAAKCMLKEIRDDKINALFISPDHGSAYLDSVYNKEWIKQNILECAI
jgi:cysteine synthase A